jgi:hypothetical protein
MTITGGCLCGNLRYEARGDPLWVGYCYCRWCQRHSGAPFLVWVLFDTGNLLWTRGTLATYASSREVERGFCLRCGSTLTFARPRRKEISVSSGSLDEPNLIEPQVHLFTDHQVAWLHIADRLPRYKRFPSGAEDREQDESPNA